MARSLLGLADKISAGLSFIAEALVLILIASMLYEVAARYVFGAPTLWAFDIAYMSTGVLFVLGAAQALREDAHVRIDFLSARMPRRVRLAVNGITFLLAVAPIFGWLALIAGQRAWRAWANGEVEHVSPWAPLMWPFYCAIAIGLTALALQLVAEGLRSLSQLRADRKFTIGA